MAKVILCFLETFTLLGGMQNFNKRVIENIEALGDPMGLDVEIFILGDGPADIPKQRNVTIKGFPRKRLRFFLSVVWRAVMAADIVLLGHINLVPIGWVAKLLKPGLVTALFVHGIEVWGYPDRRPLKFYDRLMARSLDRIISVSQYTTTVMSEVFGVDRKRFLQLPNAVDAIDVAPRTKLPQGCHILAVSRIGPGDERKNVDSVIRAVALLKDEFPDLIFDVVGEGVLRPGLEALARDLGVSELVQFHGRVSDDQLQEFYSKARVFALPSSQEGFGIVYLEAWQHGVPVICSIHGASHEIVSHGVDGFAVDEGDIPQLAARLKFFLTGDDTSLVFGERGRCKVDENYVNRNFQSNLAACFTEIAKM